MLSRKYETWDYWAGRSTRFTWDTCSSRGRRCGIWHLGLAVFPFPGSAIAVQAGKPACVRIRPFLALSFSRGAKQIVKVDDQEIPSGGISYTIGHPCVITHKTIPQRRICFTSLRGRQRGPKSTNGARPANSRSSLNLSRSPSGRGNGEFPATISRVDFESFSAGPVLSLPSAPGSRRDCRLIILCRRWWPKQFAMTGFTFEIDPLVLVLVLEQPRTRMTRILGPQIYSCPSVSIRG